MGSNRRFSVPDRYRKMAVFSSHGMTGKREQAQIVSCEIPYWGKNKSMLEDQLHRLAR